MRADHVATAASASRGGAAAGAVVSAVVAHLPAWPARLATLVAHQVRSRVRGTVVWALSLGLLGTLYTALYPSMSGQMDRYLESMPEEYLAFLGLQGGGMSTLAGFLDIEQYSIVAPLALAFLPIILGARAIAGAEESKSLDVLLSNPLPRWMVVTSAFLTMLVEVVAIVTVMAVLVWVPVKMSGQELAVSRLAAGSLNLVPLCLFFGGLALLLSAVVRRPGLALAVPGALLVASYVLNGLAAVIDRISGLQPLSIFHHYGSAIREGMPWGSAALISLLAVTFVALAALGFARRDIYT
ncbi:MAG: ABC transporter permease subunit [Thermoleophilia bacterium]